MKNKPNRLIRENSPYLIQHAHNPVDWYPWGEEALTRAKNENKLILISIGYAACHWCHVMEKESFENEGIASLLNEYFISIKVDREERPDLDQIYMSAVQLMSGSGGWPLNCFLTPEGKPFYGGTYFPALQFKDILDQLHNLWKDNEKRLREHADGLCEGIRNSELIKEKNPDPGVYSVSNVYKLIKKEFDEEYGGLNRVPKFPMPSLYRFLLNYSKEFNDKTALEHTGKTVQNMLKGGIYDQLAGGLARYSTDRYWFIPHFEKMLYDNAQFISLLSGLYAVSEDNSYKYAIEDTIHFLNTEMRDVNKAYYSSIDADSEGEEGKFYVWTQSEISETAGMHTEILSDYYGIKPEGNWENKQNILRIIKDENQILKKYQLNTFEFNEIRETFRKKLLSRRQERQRPLLDDKILTSWNSLMISALTDAWQATGEEKFLQYALDTGRFLSTKMYSENSGLKRSYKSKIPGFLDDYSYTAEAFINLYQATFDESFLDFSRELCSYCFDHFYDQVTGMFYYSPDSELNPVARQSEISDSVLPSSNSVMSVVLYYLSVYDDNNFYRNTSEQMLMNVLPYMLKSPSFFSNWAKRLLLHEKGGTELVITGKDFREKRREFCGNYFPHVVFAGSEGSSSLNLLKEKFRENESLIYVCKNRTCMSPVKNAKDALEQIESMNF